MIIWAPAKTSDILEQLHQDIDTWYYHGTLRNDRGDTKNDDFWYTCLPDFITNIKSLGTTRDTQKTMTISATSFRGCNRFSPLLIYIYIYITIYIYIYLEPNWPLFWGVDLRFYGSNLPKKKGHLGIYTQHLIRLAARSTKVKGEGKKRGTVCWRGNGTLGFKDIPGDVWGSVI